jgi:hypothetical protein
MRLNVQLFDDKLMPVATFHDVAGEVARCGVVRFQDNYYTFVRNEVSGEEIHMCYGITDLMEVK